MTRDELLIAMHAVPVETRIMCSDGFNTAQTLIYHEDRKEVRLVRQLSEHDKKAGWVKIV